MTTIYKQILILFHKMCRKKGEQNLLHSRILLKNHGFIYINHFLCKCLQPKKKMKQICNGKAQETQR